jgi:hypothetical protein
MTDPVVSTGSSTPGPIQAAEASVKTKVIAFVTAHPFIVAAVVSLAVIVIFAKII